MRRLRNKMYYKDYIKIVECTAHMEKLIDEIPRDMKSKTFFQPNRSLHELLRFFLKRIEDTLSGDASND